MNMNSFGYKEGEIMSKIMTKQGSKELQKAIEKVSPIFIDYLVKEIEPHFSRLLIDQYGNYFCQKLFVKMSEENKLRLLKTLLEKESDIQKPQKKKISKFFKVSADSRGTHALQCFIESTTNSAFHEIVSQVITKDTLTYAYNKHATHVLIKFIRIMNIKPYLEGIYDIIVKQFTELSSDPNGLPLIKNVIAKFYLDDYKAKMIRELSNNSIQLSQNAYGNYAI